MLQSIEVLNYQSHKSTTIELHPGLNIISGTTDSGKSSLLRAVLWAVRNRPMGEGFKNWDADEKDSVSVALDFDDAWLIKSRTKGKNMYETEEGTFEALRADVPVQITNVHRLVECNIQTQIQPYFLLQDSPGERGKLMNKLVGLDIIDRISKKINSKVKNARDEINRADLKVASLSESVDALPDLSAAEAFLNKIAHDIDEAEKMQEKLNTLTTDTSNLATVIKSINELREFLYVEPDYHVLADKIVEHQKVYEESHSLEELLKKHREIRAAIEGDKDWLEIEAPYLLITGKIVIADSSKLNIKIVEEGLDDLETAQDAIKELATELKTHSDKYLETIGDAGECPVCHSVMGVEALNNLEKKL